MTDELLMAPIVSDLEQRLQCNCDLDNWEPEKSTGHSCVCRIHKEAIEAYRKAKQSANYRKAKKEQGDEP